MKRGRHRVAEANAEAIAPSALPPGWRLCRLGTLAALQPGYAFKSAWFRKNGVRLLRGTNIEPGGTRWDDVVHLDPSAADEFVAFQLSAGDIVIAMDRPIVSSGLKVASLGRDDVPALLLQRVGRFRPCPDLDRGYLHAYLNGPLFISHIQAQATGTQLPHVSGTDIESAPLPTPPLPEQRRIVAKLDAIQTRSRRAREALASIPPLLEKLRQSILAAAFRGDLTKDWRAKHPDVEPASELLKRIRVERRKKWEDAELGKMVAKGKPPKDDRWKEKYQAPKGVDPVGLPSLPEGWCWATVGETSLVTGGLTKNESKRLGGREVPLVSVAAVQLREIVRSQIGSIRLGADDGDNALLEVGDLLVVEGNGSLSHIGRVALWDGAVPEARHQNHLIRVRSAGLPSALLLEWLASPRGRDSIVREATSGAGLYTLSISKIERLPLPLPPAPEQAIILDRLKVQTAGVAATEFAFAPLMNLLAAVDRAILAKAFRGELVPQDPSDTPVSLPAALVDPPPAPRGRPRKRAS